VPRQREILPPPAFFGDRRDHEGGRCKVLKVGLRPDGGEVEVRDRNPVLLELGDKGVDERLKSIGFGVQGAIPALRSKGGGDLGRVC